ncbi:hypothetical protein C8Q79DRAFT_927866 [Trametes meyenii]|nr:hypothetical protein C8Q79DRAFT_927866 [Trametes meyenii]
MHGFDDEELRGRNIMDGAKLYRGGPQGGKGECGTISWKSKALIEDLVIASGPGILYTFVYIPIYYSEFEEGYENGSCDATQRWRMRADATAENLWTNFFAPSYDEEKGFNWSVGFLPHVPIFAFGVADIGSLVLLAFRKPENHAGIIPQ